MLLMIPAVVAGITQLAVADLLSWFGPRLGVYVVLGGAVLVAGFASIFLITCLCERQYLTGDVEPASEPFRYKPSPYWSATRAAALQFGLQHMGDFATKQNTSHVKGILSLFITQDRVVMAAVFTGSAVGATLKKTVLRTRLTTGKVLESADNGGVQDLSGVIDRAILLNAGIAELSSFHARRIEQAGCLPLSFNPSAALQDYEQIDLDKGARWVLQGLARWVDPQETSIRMTFRGAWAQLKSLFRQTSKLTEQQHRIHIRRAGS